MAQYLTQQTQGPSHLWDDPPLTIATTFAALTPLVETPEEKRNGKEQTKNDIVNMVVSGKRCEVTDRRDVCKKTSGNIWKEFVETSCSIPRLDRGRGDIREYCGCRVRWSSVTKKKKFVCYPYKGCLLKKNLFLHASNVSHKKMVNHAKRTNWNVYTPVSSLHNETEDKSGEGRRQTLSGETQATNRGRSGKL